VCREQSVPEEGTVMVEVKEEEGEEDGEEVD
jgi:hypothetical protein